MHDNADADAGADAVAVASAIAVTLTLADENVVVLHIRHPWNTRALRHLCCCFTASMTLTTNAHELLPVLLSLSSVVTSTGLP